jgi:acyl-CoA synthetase (NDP forming)
VGNPVDLTPQVDPQQITHVATRLLAEAQLGGVLAINVGLDIPEFAEGLIAAARSFGRPLVACAVDAPAVIRAFSMAGVPVYPTPERAVRAYRALWLAGQGPLAPPRRAPRPVLRVEIESILASAHGAVPYDVSRELLTAYGVRFCREALAASEGDVLQAARKIGFPVVLKSARADLLHKTEVGAVVVGVRSIEGLREAHRSIGERTGCATFLVQEQVAQASELLVGGRRDEVFGPVVLVGLGGFLTEVVRDISLALAPLSLEAASDLVPLGLRGRLISGYRGLPAWEPEPVARALVAIGHILTDHPRVREVDVNPLLVRGPDAVAVDALVVLD